MAKKKETSLAPIDSLYNDISALIVKSKQKAISHANSAVNMLFWHVGTRINTEILKHERAEYGKQVIWQTSHWEPGETAYGEVWPQL